MAQFTLAHLSDPHLAPLPKPRLIELAGKRVLGYVNWTRNRHKYQRREVLDALVTDMKAQAPDHIAVTGDLVNLALEAEFAPARAWLEGVGPPDRVTTIPGNHDAYVRATSHRFSETFAPYVTGDDGGIGFPSVRRRGPLALISLSTAVPTLPLMATGTLGPKQLAALATVLERLAAEDVFRVLLVHHPLRSDARQKRMTDAPQLLALLKRHGVELVLHGHDHVHSTIWVEGPNGKIPVLGVPSASALAHGHYPAAAYNLLRIEKDNAGWRCEQTVRSLGKGFQIGQIKHVRLI
ncbi:metallophosphoesterase [Bradyrhizobium japonicum]|uniref:metallophosphoesterase family protein n=1 Tax=Bradyrhizobium japonicum TaxID=375 RepID=UPI001BA99C13|nr:metallophosphoesterase [Bradyrhizobium japonicum]MBR0993628.1 metallophosphoesterase [Bradyrhizobium japonicum]